MPVPYGFGVGDFLALGALVWKVYNAYADAPEQFRNFSREILSLHIVTKKVEDQLCTPEPYRDDHKTSDSGSSGLSASGNFTVTLGAKDTEDLRILYDGLQTVVTELDALLTKYKRLASNPIISFDRLKWGVEDLAGLRERIHANISLLTAFNASLANCQLAKQSAQLVKQNSQLVKIQEQLDQIVATAGLHRRGSVASLHSIASFALSIRQKQIWKELCRELHSNGVTADMIKAKKEEIFKVFRTATTMSSSGKTKNDNTFQQQGPLRKGWATLDNAFQALTLSATRAQYYVAALGSTRGFTTLHVAASRGDLRVVEQLLEKATIHVDTKAASSLTSIHLAATNGHTEVVKILLDQGADIHAATDGHESALHWAASEGHVEVVKVLLNKGADIHATDDQAWSALHRAAFPGHVEVVRVLLDNGADIHATDDRQWTVVHWAASRGHTEVVKVLLDKGADIHPTANWSGNALHWAAYWGHVEIVKMLLDKGADIHATDDRQWSALHRAAKWGHVEVVKVLLEYGVNIEGKTISGQTALDLADTQAVVRLLTVEAARITGATP